MSIKQVIVYRRDLKMRKGKIAAQCCHASMAVFFNRGSIARENLDRIPLPSPTLMVGLTEDMAAWVEGAFTKIVLSVGTEEDLLHVHEMAKSAGIPTSLITDAGKTEFKKKCPDCDGEGFPVWLTGCPECGASPPCDPPTECPGPDEVCGTCKGSGKVSVPTHTTVALGPAEARDIDKITGPGGLVPCKLA